MDEKISLYLYSLTEKSLIFKNIIIYINKYSSFFFKFLYFLGFLYLLLNNTEFITFYLIIPFFTLILVKFLQKMLMRNRPFVALKKEPLISHKNSGSFPSTHSASSMIIALSISKFLPSAGFILIPLAFITGLARVPALLHYMSDVIFGFVTSIIIFFICFFI